MSIVSGSLSILDACTILAWAWAIPMHAYHVYELGFSFWAQVWTIMNCAWVLSLNGIERIWNIIIPYFKIMCMYKYSRGMF